MAACRNDSDVQEPKSVTIVPDLTGYNTMPLMALEGRRDGPAQGTFSYMMIDGAIDWYLFAAHVSPGRAYRVVLSASDGKEYAIASRRAGPDGSLGVHGVETALMNRQCVGAEDPSRRPLETARALHRDWLKRMLYFPAFLAQSIGLSVNYAKAAVEAWL
jgi:hypothetical protein